MRYALGILPSIMVTLDQAGIEEDLGGFKALLVVHLDDVVVGHLVRTLFKAKWIVSIIDVIIEVLTNRTHLLLETSDHVWMVLARDSRSLQRSDELVGNVLPGNLHLDLRMRKSIAFEDRNCVTDTFATFDDETADATC